MSAASWQVGPSYNPFLHTSNSQYGAWSGSTAAVGYPGSRGSVASNPRKTTSAFIPAPPSRAGDSNSRISEVTSKDISKILPLNDSDYTQDKFAGFMSKYSSAKITSQYDRALAQHSALIPHYKESKTPHNSPDTDTGASPGGRNLYSSSGLLHHQNSDLSSRYGSLGTNSTNKSIYGTLPPRPKEPSNYQDDSRFGIQRSQTTLGNSDTRSVYSDGIINKYSQSNRDSRLTDLNNNQSENGHNSQTSSGNLTGSIKANDQHFGLRRSNTFHGRQTHESTYNRYSGTRVGIENLISDKREAHRASEPQTLVNGVSSHSESSSSSTALEPYELKYLNSNPGSSLYDSTSRDSAKSNMYWLYGSQGRPAPDTTPQTTNRPVTPYRPGDYLLRSDNIDTTYNRYSSGGREPMSEINGSSVSDPLDSKSFLYPGGRVTPFVPSSDRRLQETHLDQGSYGPSVNGYDSHVAPDVVEMSVARKAGKSILKRANSFSVSDYGSSASYGMSDIPNYHSFTAGHINQHLPPLSSPRAATNTIRRASGKRVTFNLALNRSKAILD